MEKIARLIKEMETGKLQRFSPEQIQTFTSNFSESLMSAGDDGGFGVVYKGILPNGVHIAVKVFRVDLPSDDPKDRFKMEMDVLSKTRHRHLVKLYGFCSEENMKATVYEFMEHKALHLFLYGSQKIEWEILYSIVMGAAKGLSYLHKNCQPRIIHCDIKPSNILLDSKFFPKIGNFGSAKLLNQGKYDIVAEPRFGTPKYAAPELCMPNALVTKKSDVYSFGITLLDIIGKRRNVLIEGQQVFPRYVWEKFEQQQHEELMKECGIEEKHREEVKRILLIALHCVQFLPNDRPSMSQVVRLLKGKEVVEMPPYRFSTVKVSDRNNNPQIQPILIGPWGGPHGEDWDNGVQIGVRQLLVFREEKEICGIKIKYHGKHKESYWSDIHGTADSSIVNIIKFDYPNEILTKVTGYYGPKNYFLATKAPDFYHITHLRSLCFITNKKTYGPFGYENGIDFSSGKDGKVVGFHGRSNEFLTSIGLHIQYSDV